MTVKTEMKIDLQCAHSQMVVCFLFRQSGGRLTKLIVTRRVSGKEMRGKPPSHSAEIGLHPHQPGFH